MSFEVLSRSRCFDGEQLTLRHASMSTGTPMRLALYLPPQAARQRCPMVIYLSGLTCTEENVTVKAGAQRVASQLGLIFVSPDNSPRGEHVPDDPAHDLGQGASFYVDATQALWTMHFRIEIRCNTAVLA
jgi:S-formylglutathione hydrolase